MTTQSKSMQAFWQDSYLFAGSEGYIESLYEDYLEDKTRLSPFWRDYFDRLLQGKEEISHAAIRAQFLKLARQPKKNGVVQSLSSQTDGQEQVMELISAYRCLGHLQADIDPLRLRQNSENEALSLAHYGFSTNDLTKIFHVGSFSAFNKSNATLHEINDALRRIYCGTIGFEYMHINRTEETEWIRKRIEETWAHFCPTKEEKQRILDRLVVADGLEKYLGFKYVGQKRYSLEGGDSLIPFLDTILNRSAQNGIKEIMEKQKAALEL